MKAHPLVALSQTLLTLALPSSSLLLSSPIQAQPRVEPVTATEPRSDLTLNLVMSDPDWIGNAPSSPFWADDGQTIYYEQKRQGEEHDDLIHMDLAGNILAVVEDKDRGAADTPGGAWSQDRLAKVFARAGDIFLKDMATGTIRQLTRTSDVEQSPFFMAGDQQVAWRRGESIYVRDLGSGLEYQAADLQLADDPDEAEKPTDYLAEQQPRLLSWVRRQQEKKDQVRDRALAGQKADPTRPPLPWYLGEDTVVLQSHLSPRGDWMLVSVTNKARDRGKNDQMPNYVSDDGYVSVREVRAKVGTGDGQGERLLLLDLEAHEQYEIDLATLPGITEDPLAELKEKAKERQQASRDEEDKEDGDKEDGDKEDGDKEDGDKEDGDKEDGDKEDGDKEDGDEPSAEPRAVSFFGGIRFSPDGNHAALMIFSNDNKDRWIASVSHDKAKGQDGPESPLLRTAHHLHDEAWINWSFNTFGWLNDSRRFYFLSEETGWSQLYLHLLPDGETRRLTQGDFLVDQPQLSPDQNHIYYQANPDHPGLYEIFRVALATGESEQLTRLGGQNSSLLSPDGQRLLITHSKTTEPPELYLQSAWRGAKAKRITQTVSDKFSRLPWVAPVIAEVPSSHQDRPIFSRFYQAQGGTTASTVGNDGKKAAVVFIHGAGYLQNSHQGWSSYFREFMFHTFLTEQGYVVLDMDYRASAGYGRDWRTAIYRRMGTPEVEDLQDGVAWLVKNHDVDPNRVGVYGGSYGGFLTFMALFKQPDLFACGAALRPVSDWAHYNHPYTSNILNTPEVDPEAYELSSPIEFAEGLTKPLLMCSGMQDDNVFFQDTVRLAQRLIELEKENWEVAIYPVEPHGFREPSSWLDEYRRIFKLFQTHLTP